MTTATRSRAVFDFDAFFGALDARRRERGLGWYELAAELWDESAELNAHLEDHPLCGGAVSRLGGRGATSCQYALFALRWMGRPPEDFLAGTRADVGDARLPDAGPDKRLRWDLNQVYGELDAYRRARALTWTRLADDLDCTAGRLTNLRTARLADLELVMRVTQTLRRPAAAFVHPSDW